MAQELNDILEKDDTNHNNKEEIFNNLNKQEFKLNFIKKSSLPDIMIIENDSFSVENE